jgi:hypothetical protein
MKKQIRQHWTNYSTLETPEKRHKKNSFPMETAIRTTFLLKEQFKKIHSTGKNSIENPPPASGWVESFL